MQNTEQRVVLGRYRLGPLLGRGGASFVHRALDVQTGQQVAVKEIPVEAEMARRAGAEVRAAGRLSHPSIVRLLDFGEDHSACYLVTELVEGRSLAEVMRGDTDRTTTVVGVVADVMEGLAHAHERGVTHRDVKPANILVDRSGRGRLTDFGIARIAGEAGMTVTGGLVGTVSYMAPEQAAGGEAGPASDVYSACLVLYEALTGSNPLAGSSPAETLRRVAQGGIPPLASVRPDLPTALCQVVDGGLNRNATARPAADWAARSLRAQIQSVPRASRSGRRQMPHAPVAASGVAAAAVAGVVLHEATDLRAGTVALGAIAAGAAYAAAPWATAVGGWVIGMIALGMAAPGAAIVLGALGLVALLALRRHGRLTVLAATAPILAGLGLAPLFVAFAGLARGWRARVTVAVTGIAAALGWQVIVGADPAIDGGRIDPAWDALRGVGSPFTAVDHMIAPLQERPAILIAAAVLAAGAAFVPLVMRLRRGAPRALGAGLWVLALIVAVGVAGGSAESAAGAFIPAGILVAAWAAAPWRRLRRDADRQATVRLGATTVERLPAA